MARVEGSQELWGQQGAKESLRHLEPQKPPNLLGAWWVPASLLIPGGFIRACMKAPSSLQTRWGLSPRQEPAANIPPSRVRARVLTRRRRWQGKGQQVGGGGLALSGSQPAREQRQSKQHRAGDYLSKAPFKEARGPGGGSTRHPASVRTPLRLGDQFLGSGDWCSSNPPLSQDEASRQQAQTRSRRPLSGAGGHLPGTRSLTAAPECSSQSASTCLPASH